ncbi:MAG: hypothetical protein COA58_00465 [Bacteroidetes bacterium]|nr:MAG: hypothetical protein COA58_00465 [Bacteroidota bacterium]
MNEQTYHLINKYLKGELMGSKLDKFKAELKKNIELQIAIKSQKEIAEAIEIVREKELKAFISEQVSKKTPIFVITPTIKIAFASAAAIAFLVIAFFSISPSNNNHGESAVEEKNDTEPIVTEQKTYMWADSTLEENITKIDTQTLAITVPTILPPAPEIEVVDDEIEEEMTVIDDYDLEESLATNTLTRDDAILYDEKDLSNADVVVMEDVLLSERRYSVNLISPNFSQKISEDESLNKIQVQTTTASKPKRAKKIKSTQKDVEITNAEGKEVVLNGTTDNYKYTTPSREVTVEYWKSVVNYVGYKYNGSKVKLYGIDQNKSATFKELDNRLYINLDGTQFFIEKNNKYNRMVEVTNPTLLKVLNE